MAKSIPLWLCCECWTEGHGVMPDECPNCGAGDAWYMTSKDEGDTRSAKALYDELMDHLFAHLKTKH